MSLLKRIFLGSNYRKEWGTAVRMPVFDIRESHLRIIRMGGGEQTTSLHLADVQNREWALRSVEKNVRALKKSMRNTFIEKIVQDVVSGSYPYGGLSVPDLSNAAGIITGEQRLFYVPDDPAFGRYRAAMADKAFILVNNQPQLGENITTTEMLRRLDSNSKSYVDPKEYLKARLLDWLLADWDRHDDQWRWTSKTTVSGAVFYVVPRDRDQAFFESNGLLVKFAGLFFMPHLDKFTKHGRGIKGLSKKARHLDLRFTDHLKKEDWQQIIKEFQTNISDSVIECAIKKQPKEIFAIRGNKLIEKLKSRRDGLPKHVMKYQEFLSRRAAHPLDGNNEVRISK